MTDSSDDSEAVWERCEGMQSVAIITWIMKSLFAKSKFALTTNIKFIIN